MPLTFDEELYYDFNLYKKGIVLELFMMMVNVREATLMRNGYPYEPTRKKDSTLTRST